MTPVELRLSNFLSYGEDAPVLDFGAFDVACISGANGQGKSSLLDAITWALWGQARNTTGAGKPDEHLLRKGARRMQVDFTFDHLGERYRVRRAYTLTASGKTAKPELEVAVLDEGGMARVLTGPSISATQERLDEILKVDFDTFVNASFLVQGRADEFARKKPRERKETLARLLGLGRYERLEGRAAERAAVARKDMERVDQEQTWTQEQVGDPTALAAERTAARTALADARAAHAAHTATADAARAARAPLEAERVALDESLARRRALDEEREGHTARRVALAAHLDAATELLARADAIDAARADHDAARAAFDALSALHADALRLDGQLADLDRDIERRRAAHASALDRLDVQEQAARARLEAARARLATRDDVAAQHAEALAAQEAFLRLEDVRQAREQAERARAAAKDTLLRERDALVRRADDLTRQIDTSLRTTVDLEQVDRMLATARIAQVRLERLREQEADRLVKGRDAKTADEVAAEALARATDALDAATVQVDTARTLPVDRPCPTCGTPLTEAHRRTVVADAQAAARRAEDEVERRRSALAEALSRTEALREEVRALREAQRDVAVEAERLAHLDAQRVAAQNAAVERARWQDERDALQQRLDTKAYLPDVRAEYERQREALAGLPFNADEHLRLRRLADALGRHAATLDALDADARDAERLALSLDVLAQERTDLLARDAHGDVLLDLPERRAALADERAAVPFDPRRFADARARVEATRTAQADFDALRKAEREQNARLAEQARLGEALAALDREAATLDGRLAAREALDATLALHAARLADALAAATAAQQEAEAHASRLSVIDDRQKRAELHREHLATLAEQAREARERLALYKHLKTAFSRDGIPSLIIEDTLPELEERANDLLHRLTDGRLTLAFETLAEKKMGGNRETLDLHVSDETGATRPYETYSGGEAFRISFALRIALSHLLAERADVAVRMLVIDEGFGTQDPQGIQALVEAINLVKDSFDKVIVITHLDALKNAFPTRIEVRKDPVYGSTFEVVQGG